MRISIIGLGLAFHDLTQTHLSMIRSAEVIVGGHRHLNYFPEFTGMKIPITKDLKGLTADLEQLKKNGKQIVILASGDPLFYGIGTYLIHKLGRDNIDIYPNITSVSGAFAKIQEPWHDAAIISLHGHTLDATTINTLKTHHKLAVLTDTTNTPSHLFDVLKANHILDFHICVLERLGDKTESIRWFKPGDPVSGPFLEPNIVILLRNKKEEAKPTTSVYPGMPDDLFYHENGLITKSEIRVVSIAKLMPRPDSILWDLGAGSGSVSIEASGVITTGHIYAVEKNEHRVDHIEQNKTNFSIPNLTVCHGTLPETLKTLPDPDRIFIGGGGKQLDSIIKKAGARLLPGGILVVNTVLLANMTQSLATLDQLGFETEIIQMQVNKGHKMPWDLMLKSQNPIFIIKGTKK